MPVKAVDASALGALVFGEPGGNGTNAFSRLLADKIFYAVFRCRPRKTSCARTPDNNVMKHPRPI